MCLALAAGVGAQAMVESSDAFPVPDGRYVSQSPTHYTGTFQTEILSMSLTAVDPRQTLSPTTLPPGQWEIDSFFDVFTELSFDGGPPVGGILQGPVQLRLIVADRGDIFDTEIVSMSLSGDIGGCHVEVSEDPTKSSHGVHGAIDLGGSWQVDSFFDVFTELSVDGGPLIPADVPMHIQTPLGLLMRGDAFPVVEAPYVAENPTNHVGTFDTEIVSMELTGVDPSGTLSPTTLGGGTYSIDSFFDVFTELSVDGGPLSQGLLTGSATFRIVVPDDPFETTGTFATEIVSMSLSGDVGGIPVVIRESSTLPSQGWHTITDLGGGQWEIDSFFDVYTELSIDGGRTWMQPQGPIFLEITPPERGQSCFNVECGQSMVAFGGDIPPIPADFFEPGSDPFTGTVRLGGAQFGSADTIIERTGSMEFPCDPAFSRQVPIELVALSLKSCEPITVTTNGGLDPQDWDVSVDLSVVSTQQGHVTVLKTHANGGTYESTLYVQPRLTFTHPDSGEVRVLDTGLEGILPLELYSTGPSSWVDSPTKDNYPCEGNGFYHAADEPLVLQSPFGDVILELIPPQEVHEDFRLDCFDEWQEALNSGEVTPLSSEDWSAYMDQWERGEVEGKPYPQSARFLPSQLYVYEGQTGECSDAGLVMYWGGPKPQTGEWASAFKYRYGEDPDLRNSTITVTVRPPSGCNITAVSFAMVDINGLRRSWWWSVPSAIPYDVPTTVTINTAVTGVAAATPPATGFLNTPGFVLKQVMSFTVDENSQWIFGQQPVPPPGQIVPVGIWNYWHNLSVTPNIGGGADVDSKWYIKWSQPPVEIDDGLILGWDEYSNYHYPPMVADDWLCEDERPITDIHWWGSFIGWRQPHLPPQMPKAFHLAIWTDVPADPVTEFSHPGLLIWENFCDSFVWNFAGYDKDPRKEMQNEACFQFTQLLSQDEWFYQEPGPDGKNVYWLSIAAIYDLDQQVRYPWGWKTRRHHFNDDAVHIYQIQPSTDPPDGTMPPTWPPTIGSMWLEGHPIEYPTGTSWDVTFELTTNEPGYKDNPLPGDLNLDGSVNFSDLVIMAGNWGVTVLAVP